MDEVIKRIIEIEHEAQNLEAEGLAQREKIQMDTQDELRAMERNISEMSEHKMEQLHERNLKETDERLASIREHTVKKLQQIEEIITKNQDAWENRIFNRIIGR